MVTWTDDEMLDDGVQLSSLILREGRSSMVEFLIVRHHKQPLQEHRQLAFLDSKDESASSLDNHIRSMIDSNPIR